MQTRLRRAAALLAATGGATALLAVAVAGPAGANPPGPHDPIGAVTAVTAVSGGLRFAGWAADPDALRSNDTVKVIVDGHSTTGSATTTLADAAVTKKYRTGRTPGFAVTGRVAAGAHTVCAVASDIGAGLYTVLKCVTTPLNRKLTAAQLVTHNPKGALTRATVSGRTLRFQGWSSDPDYVSRRTTVVLYVDGSPAVTVTTHAYPAPRPAAAGSNSAFDISVPVRSGAHLGCIWVVNVGLGGNGYFGCRALDTRGAPGTGAVRVPAANTAVLAEAKKHIGQRYVWGAEGPKTFDCSGLVQYSYGKAHVSTPRVSQDQFAAARLIPAARVVPGDLVFTHDSEGDVYHVGIYVAKGTALAAIDEDEGINYQSIWDPADTTYGSFTHT
jgi:cell wall-associated NlpC family hydrolase